LPVGERLEQTRERIALALRIRVDEHDEAVARGRDCALQGAGLTMVFLLQQSHPRIDIGHMLDLSRGVVLRAVINYKHFDLAVVIRGQ
jgi:hypothetical protein